mmetsp:Transcript_14485/g.33341  ORF Transcript_14485/g.33341 Transcript_14485/m.33341 type:complete len:133 (-) Transcript_14485:34-432(-)
MDPWQTAAGRETAHRVGYPKQTNKNTLGRGVAGSVPIPDTGRQRNQSPIAETAARPRVSEIRPGGRGLVLLSLGRAKRKTTTATTTTTAIERSIDRAGKTKTKGRVCCLLCPCSAPVHGGNRVRSVQSGATE